MKVFEIDDKRFDIALELFSEGKHFNFNDICFLLYKENKTLEIYAISKWQFQNLNEQKALEDIERGKNTCDYLIANSKKFAELIKTYKLRFSVIEDDGKCSFEVCYWSNNKLVWK